MSHNQEPIHSEQAAVYQIRVKGHLDPRWAPWFDGLSLTLEDEGETLMTGPVVDQAALHGLLKKVRDLGMPLLLVYRVEPGQADVVASEPLGGPMGPVSAPSTAPADPALGE